jgi:hypothetical protein
VHGCSGLFRQSCVRLFFISQQGLKIDQQCEGKGQLAATPESSVHDVTFKGKDDVAFVRESFYGLMEAPSRPGRPLEPGEFQTAKAADE